MKNELLSMFYGLVVGVLFSFCVRVICFVSIGRDLGDTGKAGLFYISCFVFCIGWHAAEKRLNPENK